MDEKDWLTERFEEHRAHLKAVAYRMLGSLTEADDAVQEAWLRLSRSGVDGVENLGGWLTTIVARVCLNMLRARTVHREEPIGMHVPDRSAASRMGLTPSMKPCWPIRSDWRSRSCSTRSPPLNAWLLCCTICSTCPSTRSLRWWSAHRRRRVSSPVAPGVGCAEAPRTPTSCCVPMADGPIREPRG